MIKVILLKEYWKRTNTTNVIWNVCVLELSPLKMKLKIKLMCCPRGMCGWYIWRVL